MASKPRHPALSRPLETLRSGESLENFGDLIAALGEDIPWDSDDNADALTPLPSCLDLSPTPASASTVTADIDDDLFGSPRARLGALPAPLDPALALVLDTTVPFTPSSPLAPGGADDFIERALRPTNSLPEEKGGGATEDKLAVALAEEACVTPRPARMATVAAAGRIVPRSLAPPVKTPKTPGSSGRRGRKAAPVEVVLVPRRKLWEVGNGEVEERGEEYFLEHAAKAAEAGKIVLRNELKATQKADEAAAEAAGEKRSSEVKERTRSRRESAVTRRRAEVYLKELEGIVREVPRLQRELLLARLGPGGKAAEVKVEDGDGDGNKVLEEGKDRKDEGDTI